MPIDDFVAETRNWIKRTAERFENSGHFGHISRSLINRLEVAIRMPKFFEKTGKDPVMYIDRTVESLVSYKALTSRFPEYLQGEIENAQGGYFPDIESAGENGCQGYVSESLKRLSHP